MPKKQLNKDEIQQIFQFVEKHGIKFYDIQQLKHSCLSRFLVNIAQTRMSKLRKYYPPDKA